MLHCGYGDSGEQGNYDCRIRRLDERVLSLRDSMVEEGDSSRRRQAQFWQGPLLGDSDRRAKYETTERRKA